MEISDYVKELDLFKKYMIDVRIPYTGHICFQEITDLRYINKNHPVVGKDFTCWIFPSQIPSFDDFKSGKDMTYFGTVIQ